MMKREDYKAIKHMDKRALEQYLLNLYAEGFRSGVASMCDRLARQAGEPPEVSSEEDV